MIISIDDNAFGNIAVGSLASFVHTGDTEPDSTGWQLGDIVIAIADAGADHLPLPFFIHLTLQDEGARGAELLRLPQNQHRVLIFLGDLRGPGGLWHSCNRQAARTGGIAKSIRCHTFVQPGLLLSGVRDGENLASIGA